MKIAHILGIYTLTVDVTHRIHSALDLKNGSSVLITTGGAYFQIAKPLPQNMDEVAFEYHHILKAVLPVGYDPLSGVAATYVDESEESEEPGEQQDEEEAPADVTPDVVAPDVDSPPDMDDLPAPEVQPQAEQEAEETPETAEPETEEAEDDIDREEALSPDEETPAVTAADFDSEPYVQAAAVDIDDIFFAPTEAPAAPEKPKSKGRKARAPRPSRAKGKAAH